MRVSAFFLVCVFSVAPVTHAQSVRSAIQQDEIDYQSQCYQRWWNSELNWKFDALPGEKGVVTKGRLPYAGFIYPDGNGGTMAAMQKYDRAFHRGRNPAAAFEDRDIEVHKERNRIGLFRLRVRYETPGWHGHCNGWAAAAIRHAEPRTSVTRNGVVFSPADIKALLAELYIYSETEFLGGIDSAINPGTLHVVLANWLGLGGYPVAMDTTIGEEVWNYPIYSYACASTKRSNSRVEVNMNIAYVDSTNREFDKAPRKKKYKRFHYMLQLDNDGKIVGGQYFGDSSRIDFLWAPLQPVQGGKKGNESGNPYLDVKQVLAIWRDSVPKEIRDLYPNIDPTDEDRMPELDAESQDSLVQQDAENGGDPAAETASVDETDDTEMNAATEPATDVLPESPILTAPEGSNSNASLNPAGTERATVAERPAN